MLTERSEAGAALATLPTPRRRRNLRPADWRFVGECFQEAGGNAVVAAKMCGWTLATVRKWKRLHPGKAAQVAKQATSASASTEKERPSSKSPAPSPAPAPARRAEPADAPKASAWQQGRLAREFVLGFLSA